jgi:hypothetical protein
MDQARLTKILDEMQRAIGPVPGRGSHAGVVLCTTCVDVLHVTGAGITLMSSADAARCSLGASDAVSGTVEELQFLLGEGPGIDAYGARRPVLESDLAHPDLDRWPRFAPPAVRAGARAVFSFPLQIGVIRLGALNLYRDGPGSLEPEGFADSILMAGVVTRSVLALQVGAPGGGLGPAIDDTENLRVPVHQAAGMISVQLDISIAVALVRLRAFTYAEDRRIRDVAREVVDGGLLIC